MSIRKAVLSLPIMLITILLLTAAVWASASKTGVVTGDVVNVRTQPDTSAKIVTKLDKGDRVSVIGSQSDWFKVSVNGTTGWVNDDYMTIRDDLTVSASTGSSSSSSSSSIIGTITGSVVNVRSKPDISSDVLAKLEQGEKVTVAEKSGDWYRIAIDDGHFGWVNREYVSTRNESTSRGSTDVRPPVDTGDSVDENTDGNTDENVEEDDNNGDLRDRIVAYAKKFQGVHYVYGGSTPRGFDCSGFVSYVFKHFDISLERASADMGRGGAAVDKSDMRPGDLVFFDTNGGRNAICHVGIYIGGGRFIHASSGVHRCVTISSLSESIYTRGFMRARNYVD